MGLQPITTMLKLNNIKVLHLEVTDACNAACPQCARETDSNFNKNELHHLTVEQIKNLFSEEDIKTLDKMFMCGTYGDPAAGKHTLDIFKYFRSVNPNITLGMNTNGSLRSIDWWEKLAGIFTLPMDYVVWSIDGLSDTNHIYRINTQWDKIIKNARAFIESGGSAHWDMLVFEHNEHQIDLAEQLAKDIGFKWFRAKVSKRFETYPIEFLNPPKNWSNPVVKQGTIVCHALHEKSLYVSATGAAYPCCWLATSDYTLDKFDLVKISWETSPIDICARSCGKGSSGTSFTNQWQRVVEFS
jgi:sulfatase maturation enzyme AslB (radical SAM superfamily)